MKKLFIFAAIAFTPSMAIAQLSPTCSSLKGVYVLPRQSYNFNVSGSCVHVDGHHSPFLVKQEYEALKAKPKAVVYY